MVQTITMTREVRFPLTFGQACSLLGMPESKTRHQLLKSHPDLWGGLDRVGRTRVFWPADLDKLRRAVGVA